MNHIDGMITDEEFDKICKAFPKIKWLRHHFILNSGSALKIQKRQYDDSVFSVWYFNHDFCGNKIEAKDTDLDFILLCVKSHSQMIIEESEEVIKEFSKLT